MLDWLFHKESNDDWYVEETVKKISIDELPSSNDDNAINFCPHCGAKVQTIGAKFCVKCGKSLVDD